MNTACTYDPRKTKDISVDITKSLIPETQKQMFNILEHLLQESYANLTLETPVKAEEQAAKYINNDKRPLSLNHKLTILYTKSIPRTTPTE